MSDLPEIIEHPDYPLEWMSFSVDWRRVAEVLAEIGDGREQNFERIVIAGGVGYRKQVGERYGVRRIFAEKDKAKHGAILGYFSSKEREVRIYPEGAMEEVIGEVVAEGRALKFKHLKRRILALVYQVLIEELEHGYQDPETTGYTSLSYRFARLLSPLVPGSVLVAVIYGYVSGFGWWWYGLIVMVLLMWAFLPVWVSWIPLPGWVRRWQYRRDRREVDAKREALRIQLLRICREAIQFEIEALPKLKKRVE